MEEKEKPYRPTGHDAKIREVKRELCMLIRSVAMRSNWTQKYMAVTFGISEQSVGYIVKGYVERVSFNQIFEILVFIEPNFTLLIALDHNTSRSISPRNCWHY